MTTPVSTSRRGGRTPDTIELVGAPGPPSGLDTNWWDGDGEDALWDAAESDPPAHAPLRAVNAADTGAWSPVLEPRPPWYRTRPAAIALIAAAGRRPHNRRPGGRQPRRRRAGPARHHA